MEKQMEIIERLTDVESRSKSNTHRLNEIAKRQEDLSELVSTVKVLAAKEQSVENDVKEIKADVKTITQKAGKRWEGMVDKIILMIVTAVVTLLLSRLGLYL